MGLSIKNPDVERLARILARQTGLSVTQAIHDALREKLERDQVHPRLAELVKPVQQRIAGYGRTGMIADKAFYDELSGEL